MFFSCAQLGGLLSGRKSYEAAINLANVAFVEFGAVKNVPYAHAYLQGHPRVLTLLGEDVERLKQALADFSVHGRVSGGAEISAAGRASG